VIVNVLFSALTAGVAASPVGPIRRMMSGDTGSLKSNLSVAGGFATVAPAGGSDPTSEACAQAPDGCAKPASTATRTAKPQPSTPDSRRAAPAGDPDLRPLIASA
jgi:hypothetical protein